jgi:hypothetical protein
VKNAAAARLDLRNEFREAGLVMTCIGDDIEDMPEGEVGGACA